VTAYGEDPAPTGPAGSHADRRPDGGVSAARATGYGVLLVVLLGVLYALLQRGYWSPGNDSEFYLTTARNILAGRGYVFNGQPYGHAPPGWPAFLALLMALSRSFWVLNAAAKLLFLCAAFVQYRLLLRLTTPVRAFVCVFVAATLWYWFRFTYVLYSESLFVFLGSLALLGACQVAEGRREWWRLAGVALLCAAMVTTRWLGTVAAGVVALAAVTGEIRPKLARNWAAAGLCVLVAGAGFVLVYAESTSGALAQPGALPLPEEEYQSSDPAAQRQASKLRQIPLLGETALADYVRRVAGAGQWMSELYSAAAQLAPSDSRIRVAFNVAGWVLWLAVVVFAVPRVKRKEWLWAGLLLYAGFLVLRWRPRGRYLILFAPLLTLSVWVGMEQALGWLARGRRPLLTKAQVWMPRCWLALLLACNLALVGAAAWVQRSEDFYGAFYAGQCKPLVNACYYLRLHARPDSRIAVSLKEWNLGRVKLTRFGCGVVSFLTDRPVVPTAAPRRDWTEPSAEFVKWAGQNNVSYLLYRPPTSPWRLWHFRATLLQRWLTGKNEVPENPSWLLYRIENGRAVRIEPPEVRNWPTEVPPVVDLRSWKQQEDSAAPQAVPGGTPPSRQPAAEAK